MQRIILILLLFPSLGYGCAERPSLPERAYQIAQYFQKGEIDKIEQSFYSPEYYASIKNATKILKAFSERIAKVEIDKVENISVDSLRFDLNNPFFPPGKSTVYDCVVQLGVEMPSVVPQYLLFMRLIDKDNEWKLVACDLRTTQMPSTNNELEIEDEILIEKTAIVTASLMFEGGYLDPLVFKRNIIEDHPQNVYSSKLDSLIDLINGAEIVKAQKENDTRRFVGDPQMGIISLELSNQFNWTIFNLVSTQSGMDETFYGDLELRYGQFLNNAVTYWIKTDKPQAVNRLMLELCNTGPNTRTKPKESVKMDFEKN